MMKVIDKNIKPTDVLMTEYIHCGCEICYKNGDGCIDSEMSKLHLIISEDENTKERIYDLGYYVYNKEPHFNGWVDKDYYNINIENIIGYIDLEKEFN